MAEKERQVQKTNGNNTAIYFKGAHEHEKKTAVLLKRVALSDSIYYLVCVTVDDNSESRLVTYTGFSSMKNDGEDLPMSDLLNRCVMYNLAKIENFLKEPRVHNLHNLTFSGREFQVVECSDWCCYSNGLVSKDVETETYKKMNPDFLLLSNGWPPKLTQAEERSGNKD